jgi:hypothetical protein
VTIAPIRHLRFQVLLKQKKPAPVIYDVTRSADAKNVALLILCRVLEAIRAGICWPVRGWQYRGCEYRRRCGRKPGLTVTPFRLSTSIHPKICRRIPKISEIGVGVGCKNTIEVDSRFIAGPTIARATGTRADLGPAKGLGWAPLAGARVRSASFSGSGRSSAAQRMPSSNTVPREFDCYAASR